MEVKHALPPVFTRINHRPIAGSRDPLLPRKGRRQQSHLPGDVGVSDVVERNDVLFRDDQDVNRSFRIEIPKGDAIGGVRQHLRRYLAANDAAEDAIIGNRSGCLREF